MELRNISVGSTKSALDKARHYRLLNDPENAESICHDVLQVEPGNQAALVCLILSLTDQFDGGSSRINEAKEFVAQLTSDYDRAYLNGLICERAAKVILASHRPGSRHDAFHWFTEAMTHFDRAEQLATDEANDDPILRWNSCARLINKHNLEARPEESFHAYGD